MTRSVPYALAFLVPLIAALAVFGRGPFLLVPPFFLFILTPLLDSVLKPSTTELEQGGADRWRDARYDVWLWAFVPLQLFMQGAAVAVGARADSSVDVAGIIFASGLLGAIGINVAHELMHRKGAAERATAELLMTSVAYTHFCVEHVLGHHKNVATPHDPASAKLGENVFAFVARSAALSVVNAWRLEGARTKKLGIPIGLRDRRVRYPLVLAAVVAAIAFAVGPAGVAIFAGQAAVAIFILETINFIEHYGLSRKETAPGVYERVDVVHSWTSAHAMSSFYLFNLPRHADHHAHASRPYFALRHLEGSPQLPAGYAAMLVVAWLPPLWRRLMDERARAFGRGVGGESANRVASSATVMAA